MPLTSSLADHVFGGSFLSHQARLNSTQLFSADRPVFSSTLCEPPVYQWDPTGRPWIIIPVAVLETWYRVQD